MKASDIFVKALENEEVEYVFAVPGEENLDVLESLRTSKIKLILNRHEQVAGFMAATYGRLTGKVGVCMSTLGPGATNLVTASAYAQLGGMPLLLITGQKPITKSKQGRFQIIDTVEMMDPVTKYSEQIVNANKITSMVRDSFRIALEERPGAVHLELPEDIAASECEAHFFEIGMPLRPNASNHVIAKAATMIQEAKSPLLLIGAGANRQRTSNALKDFVDKTGIPFFNTQMGKGVIDERHPLFLGTAALSSDDYIHCAIGKADLIINVGHDVIEKPPFFMEHGGTKVIHINFSKAHIDEVYFPNLEVVGDVASSVNKLSENVDRQEEWNFDYFMRIKNEVDKHMDSNVSDDRFPLLPQRIVHDIREVMPTDGILALDNGMYKIWFARNYKAYKPNTLLLDNALATMGAGLPSAMAAALIHPEREVLAICGDGGFMMNSQDLETAVRLKLNLVCAIIEDDAYGMIKWKQTGMGFDNWGLDFKNPDFVAYAESYGAKGHRVESADGLAPLLKKCLKEPGVNVVIIPVDYSENVRVLIDELKEKTCLL